MQVRYMSSPSSRPRVADATTASNLFDRLGHLSGKPDASDKWPGRNGRAVVGRPTRQQFAEALHKYLHRCLTSTVGGDNALAGGWTANAYDALWLLRDLEDSHQQPLNLSAIKDGGTISKMRFTIRVATRVIWLYHVKELRTAFAAGVSPTDGSACPVYRSGDQNKSKLSYEDNRSEVIVGTGCR